MRTIVPMTLLLVLALPQGATADPQERFNALWEEYLRFCTRMLEDPVAFHEDPEGSFGLDGEIEFSITQDRGVVDFYLTTPSPEPGIALYYHMVSHQVGHLIQQDCYVEEHYSPPLPDEKVVSLSEAVEAHFSEAPGFEISGGVPENSHESEYDDTIFAYSTTGAFDNRPLITLLSIGAWSTSIGLTHISEVNP